jgi:hypothetical protein
MSETMTVSEDLGSEGTNAPAPDTTEAAAPLSIRETLEASYEAAQDADEPAAEVEPDETEAAPVERARGPDGKFAAKVEAPAEEAPAEVAPVADVAAPEGWGDKAKIDWNRLPASVKAEIASRVSAPQQADPIRAVAQEFAEDIAATGAPPETLFRSLLHAERELRTNPEAALKWLARSYNIDLSRLAPSQAAAQPQQAGEPVDPRMQAVYAEGSNPPRATERDAPAYRRATAGCIAAAAGRSVSGDPDLRRRTPALRGSTRRHGAAGPRGTGG